MASEDAAVVVSLRANLKDYEAALKSAVRATERAATAAEKTLSNVGKKAPAGTAISQNFQKSSQQMVNDARVLQFQLNDIFSGLASGQGVRAVQQQLGQIAQQLGGGGMIAAGRTLGAAMIGMINPINLAVVAFGILASVAASYFTSAKKGAEDAVKELDKQADALEKMAKQYGAVIPQLIELAKAQREAADAAGLQLAAQTALEAAYADADKTIKRQAESLSELLSMLEALGAPISDIAALQDEFGNLETAIEKQNASSKDAAALLRALDGIIKNGAGRVVTLAEAIRKDLVASFGELDRAAEKAGQTIDGILQTLPSRLPGAGGPLDLTGLQRAQQGATLGGGAAAMIKKEEGFRSGAYWDVNAFRVGFGSDTYVDKMGQVQRVTKETVVTLEQANADLARRIPEFQKTITDAIGPDYWKNLTEDQQAALTSIAYNYGRLPASIVKAIKEGGGQQAVAQAIGALTANPERRKREAAAFGGFSTPAATPAQKFAEDLASSARATKELNAELQVLAESGGIIQDFGYKTEYARKQQELLNKAEAEGVAITPELTAQINAAADAHARASAAIKLQEAATKASADRLREQAQAAQQFSQQISQMAQSAIGGLINDLRNGVDAGEAFNNMLNRILDSLIQMSLQSLFNPAGGGGLGSILGGLFGAPVAHSGGIVGKTSFPRRQVDPRVFAGARHYAKGGIVGGEVPIIAHRGEMIIPKGMVGKGGNSSITNNLGAITIDMAGSGTVAAGTDQAKQFGQNVQKLIQAEMVRESRPGGLLRRV